MTAEPKVSQADQLVELVEDRYRLGVSAVGEPFAVPLLGPQVVRMLRGRGGSLRAELASEYAADHSKAPSSSALADALLVLQGRAQQQPPETLHLRVAQHAGSLLLDLGGMCGRVVRVDPGGWTVLPSGPVLFRRSEASGPLPAPVPGGSLDELRRMLNVPAADWPLVVAWLVAALLPDVPHPVLALMGEHGTGKSSAARLLGGLIDPSPAQLRSAPRDVEGWAVAAAGSWVVGLDNISTVPDWFSDSLCRAVTGDGMVRRALYTDSGLSVLAFRRVVLLTSIDPGALRGDLADRLLGVECQLIDDAGRLEEAQLAADWAAAHPRVLGALLDLTAAVLEVLPGIHLTRRPRMADFGRVLAAVDEVMGSKGLARYAGQGAALAAEVVESDAVAAAVRALVPAGGDAVEHTPAKLLELTSPERPGRDWPANPRALSARLKRAAPALRVVGVEVTHLPRAGHTSRRLWRIERQPENTGDQPENTGDLPPAPAAPSATAADLRKQADGRRADAAGADGRRAEPPNRQPLPAADHTPADLRKQSPADGADGADGRKPLPSSDDDSRPGVAAWMPQREPVGLCIDCQQPAHTVDETGEPCHPGCNLPGGLTAAPRQSRQPSAPVEEES